MKQLLFISKTFFTFLKKNDKIKEDIKVNFSEDVGEKMDKNNKIIFNEFQTKLLKALSEDKNKNINLKVYNYEDYTIIFDIEIVYSLKHISISRGINKKMEESDLEFIAEYFLGKNYENIPISKKEKLNILHFSEINPKFLN